MPHMVGRKYCGKAMLTEHVSVQVDNKALDDYSTGCEKLVIEFVKQLTCSSWQISVTRSGYQNDENVGGIAKRAQDGTFTLTYMKQVNVKTDVLEKDISVTAYLYGKFVDEKCKILNLSSELSVSIEVEAENEGVETDVEVYVTQLAEYNLKRIC